MFAFHIRHSLLMQFQFHICMNQVALGVQRNTTTSTSTTTIPIENDNDNDNDNNDTMRRKPLFSLIWYSVSL